MKRRVAILSLFLAFVGICAIAKIIHDVSALSRYRHHIETTYASAIALIEKRTTELPYPDDAPYEFLSQRDAVTKEIRQVLSRPEIFAASWSLDGHHGSSTLKPMDTDGYRTYTNLSQSHDEAKLHYLYYGKTFQGQRLLVYHGWVPTGINERYTIAFYFDDIVGQCDGLPSE